MSTKTTITSDDFAHIAKLSRLTIKPEEEFIANQLTQAAEYSEVLNQLDTTNIPTTFQVNNKKNALRNDKVMPSFTQKEALSQAKKTYNGYFQTLATIKK